MSLKIIEFSGDACAGCHALLPVVSKAAKEFGIPFERVDTESRPECIEKFSIDRIPTVILADEDKVVARCAGYQPEEIFTLWLEAKIEEYNKQKQ